MDVDHFDPTDCASRNRYGNLYLSTRRCNNAKLDHWPTNSQIKKTGQRFLNPCKELEYGTHIVEHPQTHELIPLTPAGEYHIDILDLNGPDLVDARQERWIDYLTMEKTRARMKRKAPQDSFPFELVNRYKELMAHNIPLFPIATQNQIELYELRMGRCT